MEKNGTFQGYTAVWEGPTGRLSAWVAARSRADAGICALLTFAVLVSQSEPSSG
jgi:hypothetical protein